MKTWMLLVGLFALLVVPAFASTLSSESIDITCTIDDYVYASIGADDDVVITQTMIEAVPGAVQNTLSTTTDIMCFVETNCPATTVLTAIPFTLGTEELKTSVFKIADGNADDFGGTPIDFGPGDDFGLGSQVLGTGTNTIATLDMAPEAVFDPASGSPAGARNLTWGYTIQATNQTLAAPNKIALSGIYTSTWTLTITADSYVPPTP